MKKILILCSMLYACTAYAQEPTETNYNLDEVVVSGNRFPEERRDVAQKIDVIKPSTISFTNAATSAELLSESGKVFVQKSQFGGGSPILRGFEASRVLLVVDGVRMNNAIYRAGHLQNIITLDQGMLDHVEIAYGPSSLVYGSDALGGVMHFHTKNPDLLSDGENTASGSAFLRYSTAADALVGSFNLNLANKNFGSLTSVSYSDFNDLRAGTVENDDNKNYWTRPYYVVTDNGVDQLVANDDKYTQVYTGYTQYDVMQKFLYQQNAKLTHKLNFQYSTSTDIPRYDRLTDPLNADTGDSLRNAEWYYGPQERLLAAYDLMYTGKTAAFDAMHFVLSYQDIQESRHQRRFGRTGLQHRIEDVSVIGANLDFEKKMKANTLTYGLETYFNDVTSTANEEDIITGEISPLDTRYASGGSNMMNAAVFAAHRFKFNNQAWVLNDGLRFNYSKLTASFTDKTFFPFPYTDIDQQNTALTGSLGLVYSPNTSTKVSLIGSTGFRVPNVDDLTKVFESNAGSLIVPNPDLGPEKTINVDLSLVKVFKDKVELEVTGFYTRFYDYIAIEPGTFEGADSIDYDGVLSQVLTTVNKGSAYLYGFNAGLDYNITSSLNVSSYITYTYGRIETDSTPYPLDHIPPVYGRTGIRYSKNKLKAEVYALYNGWKYIEDFNIVGGEDNEQYATPAGMPSWYTLNIKASYDVLDYLTVQAGCENLLDHHYRVFASGISAPGRNVYLTLRARF